MAERNMTGLSALAGAKFTERALFAAKATQTTQYVVLGEGIAEEFSLLEQELSEGLQTFAQDSSRRFWKQKLIAAGFRPTRKTLFTWLGRSQTVTEAEFDGFLASVAELCCEGSTLLFDCSDEGLFEGFSLELRLGQHGFLTAEYLTPQDVTELLLRTGESIRHICLVQAVWKQV